MFVLIQMRFDANDKIDHLLNHACDCDKIRNHFSFVKINWRRRKRKQTIKTNNMPPNNRLHTCETVTHHFCNTRIFLHHFLSINIVQMFFLLLLKMRIESKKKLLRFVLFANSVSVFSLRLQSCAHATTKLTSRNSNYWLAIIFPTQNEQSVTFNCTTNYLPHFLFHWPH